MKKIILSIVLLVALMATQAVYAIETNTYIKTITRGQPLAVYITTYRQGDIYAHVTWNGKPSGHGVYYWLNVNHCTDVAGTCLYSTDMACMEQSTEWATQEMYCSIPNGPAGVYLIQFTSTSKADAVLNITAETNP